MSYIAYKSMDQKVRRFFSHYPQTNVPVDAILLQAQNKPEGVYYIQKGSLRQFIVSPEGKELTLHTFMPGSALPLSWILNNEIPSFYLSALTKSVVKVCPREDYLRFLKENPDILLYTSSRLMSAIAGLTKRIEILSLEDANARVLSTISYLARHFGKSQNSKMVDLRIPFTHEYIATLCGLTREKVSIEMKKLKNNKLIDYRRGRITVLDPKILTSN